MCGLVGIAGNLTVASDRAFKELLIVDSVRGPHSTGVLTVGYDGGTDVYKAVGDPFQLFDSAKYTKEMKNYAHTVLMGHNRYATVGSVVRKNAHPFECGHIIGAHNGTLTTKYLLDDSRDFEVDSENLYHHMSKNGVQDTVSNAEGALALTWYDDRDETINFLRNPKRPLCYVYSEDKKTIYWASEKWMLTAILGRLTIPHGEVMVFDTYKHYSICLGGEDMELKVTPVAAPVPCLPFKKVVNTFPNLKKPVTYKEKEYNLGLAMAACDELMHEKYMAKGTIEFYVKCKVTEGNVSYIDGRSIDEPSLRLRLYVPENSGLERLLLLSDNLFKGKIKRISKVGDVYGLVDLRSVVEIFDSNPFNTVSDDSTQVFEKAVPALYPLYNGKEVLREEWVKRTAIGCGWCDEVPLDTEADDLVWVDSDAFVCSSCAALAEVQEVINT